jgi:hemoglobin-like flavoprotein
MSANPAFPEPGPRPSPVPRKPTGKLARTIRESFAEVEDKADKLSEYFYGALFAIAPETRELFPVNMTVQRSRLLRALVHIIQRVDQPEELVPFLRQLGRDHRKFDVITHHYDAVGAALLAALKRFLGDSWTPEVEYAWTQAYGTIARTMREAAESERGPAWWPATVLACDKVTPDVAIIRVQPLGTVPFRAGDHLSVETPQRLRMWRYSHRRTHRARTAASSSTCARWTAAGCPARSSTTPGPVTSGGSARPRAASPSGARRRAIC